MSSPTFDAAAEYLAHLSDGLVETPVSPNLVEEQNDSELTAPVTPSHDVISLNVRDDDGVLRHIVVSGGTARLAS